MFSVSFFRIITALLSIVGATFLIPISVAIHCGEYFLLPSFVVPMVVSFILMLAVNIPTRKQKIRMNMRQTYAAVALAWIAVSFMGAIPLFYSGCFSSVTDAIFESFSGFSTTGATVVNDIDNLPRSINLWRCLTHWIGGMGIVTLTVALLPILGVGGFQLIKAETTGPEKGKVTARITTTAKVLWGIYIGFTASETILLKLAGMDFIDALSHSFATLGTGGFSTKSASIGQFDSTAIDIIVTIYMFLSGINFSLFFYIVTKKFEDVWQNSELKAYISIVFFVTLGVAFCILPTYKTFGTSLRYAAFQVVSLLTTTGFTTADFTQWASSAQFLLFMLFFIGGCSGSTSGGVKVIRWVILGKQLNNETKRMLHPHGIFAVKLDGRVGRKDIVFSVASFMTMFVALVAVTTFIGCLFNMDLYTSFTAAVSMVGNVGPAFGQLGPSETFAVVPDFVKYWYCFAMLAGRLELYTMLIFFMPSFWKK